MASFLPGVRTARSTPSTGSCGTVPAVEIFDGFFDQGGGWDFLSRFGHILSGITWIGLLYFFNFVQVPAYAQLSDGARVRGAPQAHVAGALVVPLRGAGHVPVRHLDDRRRRGHGGPSSRARTAPPSSPACSSASPCSSTSGASSGATRRSSSATPRTSPTAARPTPTRPAAAKKAARASRCNTLLLVHRCSSSWCSPPTAGFWGADEREHDRLLDPGPGPLGASSRRAPSGFIGGFDSPFNKLVFDDHRSTIAAGFILLAVIYFIGWELLLAP